MDNYNNYNNNNNSNPYNHQNNQQYSSQEEESSSSNSNKTIKDIFTELDDITTKLNDENIPLEEAVALFKTGAKLIKNVRNKLNAFREEISKINIVDETHQEG